MADFCYCPPFHLTVVLFQWHFVVLLNRHIIGVSSIERKSRFWSNDSFLDKRSSNEREKSRNFYLVAIYLPSLYSCTISTQLHLPDTVETICNIIIIKLFRGATVNKSYAFQWLSNIPYNTVRKSNTNGIVKWVSQLRNNFWG